MKLQFPAGLGGYQGADGTRWIPDAHGQIDIGDRSPIEFYNAGFSDTAGNSGPTSARPSAGTFVGDMFFDLTLSQPIWWTGSSWVNALGTPA